jgi:azurin
MAPSSLLALVSLATLLAPLGAQEIAPSAVELRPHPQVPLAFDKTELSGKAGSRITLTLNNIDGPLQQPHNFVLIKPGKIDAVGTLATAMITDPKAIEKNYIPEQSTDIIAHTPLVQPGESVTIEFTLPTEPGDYPFMSTFPGHWLQMRGTFHVSP